MGDTLKNYHQANGELHEVKQFVTHNITFNPPIYWCPKCDLFFPKESVIVK